MSDYDLLRQAAALMREQHGPEHPPARAALDADQAPPTTTEETP